MMHGHEKSRSAIVAVKPTNKSGAIRCGMSGAKGGDHSRLWCNSELERSW